MGNVIAEHESPFKNNDKNWTFHHEYYETSEINNSYWNLNTNNSYYYSNITEFEYFQYPLAFQICVYILYNLVFVCAVFGNILVIYVVASNIRMRTVTNYLIANLALGDLLMALVCVPFTYYTVLHQYWPFGLVLCHVVSPAQSLSVFVSGYTLVALAVDRYMAIVYPLRPRLRRSQALFIIATIWLVALLTAVPTALFTRLEMDPVRERPLCEESAWSDENWKTGYGYTLLVLQYFFPICVLIYTYSRIALEIWWKKKPLLDSSSESDGQFSRAVDQSREQRLSKSRRKTVVMTLCVCGCYTLAWLPLNLFGLYMDTLTFDPDEYRLPYLEYIFFACHWLAMAHTTYNPFIYAWVNIKFRMAFATVFTNLFKRGEKNRGLANRQHFMHPQGSTLSRVQQQQQHIQSQPTGISSTAETKLIVRNFNPTKRM